jgi:hypothetical protein
MTMPTTVVAATTTSRSERMRVSSELVRAAVCWAALGLVFGCANKKLASEQASSSSAPTLAALPEPAGLVAELALAHPDSVFKALRELGAPMSALLPAGFPLLTTTLLGLPPLSADSFDPDISAVGALAESSNGEIGWVVALHAVSGPELVAKLSTGDRAPFRAQLSATNGLTLLEPTPPPAAVPAPPRAALAVFDNYLLVATTPELLPSFGPYVARMLPRQPPSQASFSLRISPHALATEVVPALRASWASYRTNLASQDQSERAAHGGRAPDFGDPAQVILGLDAGVESMLAGLESATHLELDIEPFSDRLEATLVLTPAVGSPAQGLLATLGAGDANELLTFPAQTRLAFGATRSSAERDSAAKVAGDDWVRLLGSRMSERDTRTLRGVLADWELGRGARSSYGYLGGADPGAFLVADVADAAHLRRAAHGFFGLLTMPGIRAPLSEFLGQPRVNESATAHLDFAPDVQLAKVAFSASNTANHATAAAPPLSFAWFVEEKTSFAASGKDAEPVLKQVVQAARAAEPSLGASPGIAGGVQRIGDQAALFAYADARALAASMDATQPAPVFFSIGKRNQAVFLRIEVSKPAISVALDRALGH